MGNKDVKDQVEISYIDPVDVVAHLVQNPKKIIDLAATTLKGARAHTLREDLVKSLEQYSEEYKQKLKNASPMEKIHLQDDITQILEAIESSDDALRIRTMQRIFIKSLQLEEKERVYLRKLVNIVKDLTSDQLLTIQAMSNPEVESARTGELDPGSSDRQSFYYQTIADVSGLSNQNFVNQAIAPLTDGNKVFLVHSDYFSTNHSSPLTQLGEDIATYLTDDYAS